MKQNGRKFSQLNSLDGWRDGWMEGWMHGWVDRWGGRMDAWIIR
jgi:hypothetical protein